MLRKIDKIDRVGRGGPYKPHGVRNVVGSHARGAKRIIASLFRIAFKIRAGIRVVYPSAELKADLVGDALFLSVKSERKDVCEHPAGDPGGFVWYIPARRLVFRQSYDGAFGAFEQGKIFLRHAFFKISRGEPCEKPFKPLFVPLVVAQLSGAEHRVGVGAEGQHRVVHRRFPLLQRVRAAAYLFIGETLSRDRRAEQRQKHRIVAEPRRRLA